MSTLEEQSEVLAAKIGAAFSQFEGLAVRADAGEEGRIFVALRKAKKEREKAERFAKVLHELVEQESGPLDFRLSQGAGDKDLLFLVELIEKKE